MQWIKNIPKSDWVIIAIYFFVVLNLQFWGEWFEEDWSLWSQNTWNLFFKVVLREIFIQFCVVLLIVYYIVPIFFDRKKYVLSIISIVGLLMMMGVMSTWTNPYRTFDMDGGMVSFLFWQVLESGEVISFPCFLLLAKSYYKSQNQMLALQKEKKEGELKVLQAQVDPHFLFNNLNILDILIDTDTKKAKKFTRKLSSLYRYMIRHKDEDVVSLETEWKFCQSYLFLIEQRFNGLFPIHSNLDQYDLENYFVPPAAMQTIIENVTKHNIALPARPVETWITIKENCLEIKNDYRPKEINEDQSGTGLNNLSSRIELLTDEKLKIEVGDQFYKVTIPLVTKVLA